jgi:hypothetical protein
MGLIEVDTIVKGEKVQFVLKYNEQELHANERTTNEQTQDCLGKFHHSSNSKLPIGINQIA